MVESGRQMEASARRWYAYSRELHRQCQELVHVNRKLGLFLATFFNYRHPESDFQIAKNDYEQNVDLRPLPSGLQTQLRNQMDATRRRRAERILAQQMAAMRQSTSLTATMPSTASGTRLGHASVTGVRLPSTSSGLSQTVSQSQLSAPTYASVVSGTPSMSLSAAAASGHLTHSSMRSGPRIGSRVQVPAFSRLTALPPLITSASATRRPLFAPLPFGTGMVSNTDAVPGTQSATGLPMTAALGFRSQLAPVSGATMAPLMTDFSSSQMPVHLAGAGMTARSLPVPVTAMSGVHSVSSRRRFTDTSTRGTYAAVSGALPSLTAAHSAASHPMVGTSISQTDTFTIPTSVTMSDRVSHSGAMYGALSAVTATECRGPTAIGVATSSSQTGPAFRGQIPGVRKSSLREDEREAVEVLSVAFIEVGKTAFLLPTEECVKITDIVGELVHVIRANGRADAVHYTFLRKSDSRKRGSSEI